MKLIEKSERNVNIQSAFNTYKALGGKVENIGRFLKWKNCANGRMSVHLDVYKVVVNNEQFNIHDTWYVISDTLGRVAFNSNNPEKVELNTIKEWLAEKGYKTEKDFYIKDYGMTEEAYQEWCEA